nr:ribonuclease H-like domain-containing protein [Tanacetum cinerariifolium]
TPKKVLVREEASSPITKCVNAISFVKMEKDKSVENNEIVDKSVIEPSELNIVEPIELVDKKEEIGDGMVDEFRDLKHKRRREQALYFRNTILNHSPNFGIAGKSSFMDPSKYPGDPNMPELEDIVYSDDDEDVGAEADLSNLETNIPVSPIPTTRVHKDHHVNQIIVFDCDELNSSESDVSVPTCLVHDRYKSGEEYHAVPPPYTGTFMPPKPDLVFHDAPTASKTVPTVFNVEPNTPKPNKDLSQTSVKSVEHPTQAENLRKDIPKSRGYVAYGENPKGGEITGKDKIRTDKLDFDDVYFVKELKFNLFSVSQMCDKKNNVLFTDTECVVLYFDFKLPDETHVLLRVLRENNNVDLKNIVPSGDLTCLFTKATLDESNLWHRRLGHINFKIMNKLVKGNQPNHNACIQGNFDASKVVKEAESAQQYVLLPLWSTKNESKVYVSPSSSAKTKKHDDKAKREAKGKSIVDVSTGVRNLSDKFEEFFVNSANRVNAVSAPVTAVGPNSTNSTNSFNAAGRSDNAINMPALEDIVYSDDEEDVGAEADFSNLETSITGHTQEEGIEYEEVFTPVARIEAIRLFLAYASFMGFMVYQMDVKSAFLYGTIEEEVYVCQPLGFEDLDYPDKVYKVVKALYGLQQAARACQDKYVAEILKKFGLIDGKSASTPIDTEKPLLKDLDGKDVDVHIYRHIITAVSYTLMLFGLTKDVVHLMLLVSTKKSNDVVKLQALIDRKKVIITEDTICQALRLDDADGIDCLPNEEIFAELTRMGYEKPSKKLIFYKAFFLAQWKFLIHMIVQCMSAWNEFSSSMAAAVICLATGGCIQTRGKIAELDADEDVTLVDVDADTQGRMEEDVTAIKDINAAESEPKIFNDEEVTMSMAQTLIKMKAEKARILDEQMAKRLQDEEIKQAAARERQEKEELKRAKVLQQQYDHKECKHVQTFLKSDRDEEPSKKRVVKETLLQESFKKLRAEVEVLGSHSIQEETPTVDPVEISQEDIQNMLQIIPMAEFKVEALQDFDRDDLDALWRITREKFSTSMPTHIKEKALWAELTRLYDIYMLAQKDYPLSDGVMTLMLSSRLQVEEDSEAARDLVMKIFLKANQPKKLDVHVRVYVPKPEQPEYHVPSDNDMQVKDQPYADDASLTAKSPGYIADSESMEEDSIDYPDEPEDDDEDLEEDPSKEHKPEDDDEDPEEDPSEEHEPEDEYTKDEEPSEGFDETEPFKEDETAVIPPPPGHCNTLKLGRSGILSPGRVTS